MKIFVYDSMKPESLSRLHLSFFLKTCWATICHCQSVVFHQLSTLCSSPGQKTPVNWPEPRSTLVHHCLNVFEKMTVKIDGD